MADNLNNLQADLFKAIAHPTRIAILHFLRDGERCVCEIFPALEIEQPNLSRHLSILKNAGILSSRKDGLKVIYRVDNPQIFELLDLTTRVLKDHWSKREKILL